MVRYGDTTCLQQQQHVQSNSAANVVHSVLPYIPNPLQRSEFAMYMAVEWVENLSMSLHNLIASCLRYVPLPSLFLIKDHQTRMAVIPKSPVDLLHEVWSCDVCMPLSLSDSGLQEIADLRKRLEDKELELRTWASSASSQRRRASLQDPASTAVNNTMAVDATLDHSH